MEFIVILFYLFASLTVIASVLVVSARNPVHSVLWLIFAFFNSAGLFILLGAEMLAMLLVIVYVGAVAVLFLFVVMMLNVKTTSKKGFKAYLPIGLLLATVLLVEMILVIQISDKDANIAKGSDLKTLVTQAEIPAKAHDELASKFADRDMPVNKNTNAHQIGNVLYTDYILYFQTSGLILLVAMIGAIVLTLRHRDGVRRQVTSAQVNRKNAIDIIKVESGKGVE